MAIFSLRDQIFLSLPFALGITLVWVGQTLQALLWRLCGYLHHSFFVKLIKDFPVVVSAFELNITVRQGGKAVGTGFLDIDFAMFFAPLDYFLYKLCLTGTYHVAYLFINRLEINSEFFQEFSQLLMMVRFLPIMIVVFTDFSGLISLSEDSFKEVCKYINIYQYIKIQQFTYIYSYFKIVQRYIKILIDASIQISVIHYQLQDIYIQDIYINYSLNL
ncbi:Hypothetical_protein [Hexamita inflata]|uniref:Hypothetical_protein n=1 Tax=Hexamita inflata TaxID=28002 RepID=A0AA86NHB9_9EUKA|nr:Hypothetical protein HINF_LOCUS7464 [Hexamita inflata]CAI9956805.1 Hypothetical protein HINF_LOCUS44450 [Hexamita inflata]